MDYPWRVCANAECGKLFSTREKSQQFCSRRCARIIDARHGIPTMEDKKARFADGMLKLFDDIFKDGK